MTETSENAAAATAEAKSAAAEFLKGFHDFKEDMSKRMTDMTTRIESLDRKSAELRRPALETSASQALPHAKAFAAYVRRGQEDELKGLDLEAKGLNTAVSAEGGYLIDPRTAEQIETVLRSGASIRALSRVVQVEAGSYDVLVDHEEIGAGWLDETSTVSETAAPVIDRIAIQLHELSASPKASQRLLDDTAFDVEAWLAERIADRFKRAEQAAFVNGDGVGKPKGFLTKTTVANAGWSWGSLGYVVTGTSGGRPA